MKVKHLLVALLVPFACACSNDSLNEVVDQSNQPQVVSRSAENMLSFDSEASFQQAVETLKSMNSWEEKNSWLKSNFGDFQSMQSVYDAAMVEAENLGETEEEYKSFKDKYSTLYFPMYQEDCGYYIPLKDLDMATLVNENGNVRIAGNVVNKKDITSYQELMDLGRAYYEGSKGAQSRAVGTSGETFIFDKNVEDIGSTWDSGWHKENGKKVKLKIRRRIVDWSMKLHTEFCFRKKTVFGWANYSSTSTITGTAKMYNDSGDCLQTIDISHHESGHSSHDADHGPLNVYRSALNPYTQLYTYSVLKVVGNASVDYRGIGSAQQYNWTLVPATNENKASYIPIKNLIQ